MLSVLLGVNTMTSTFNLILTLCVLVDLYSDTEGKGYMWAKVTYPGMKRAVINVLQATQDVAESRKVSG